MDIISKLLDHVATKASKATVVDVSIGMYWSIVALELNGTLYAGLCSTLGGGTGDHHHGQRVPVQDAGHLHLASAQDLANLAREKSLLEASVGLATINALLDINTSACVEVNAAEVIAQRGTGRAIAVIGHFPFVPRLRAVAGKLWVLEQRPHNGDLPASRAADILPQADVIAMTGTTLLNHTFDGLIPLCNPEAFVIMLGASTPLSNFLFDRGVDAVAGTQVINPHAAVLAVRQGATFKQIPGKRLLTLFREVDTPGAE